MRSGDVSNKSQMMNLNINYVKWLAVLPTAAYYEMNIGAQYSPDNLTLQDQFTIGADGVFAALKIVMESMAIRVFYTKHA
jgi:hemolysin activation/secretion protein